MVSEIAFGGVGIGLSYADQPMPSRDSSLQLLSDALDQGINFYDTARQYGESEALIGEAFSHKREDVIIATKAAHFLEEDGSLPPSDAIHSRIRSSLDDSLTDLQTDYVDIFMLHQCNREVLENESIQTVFSSLKKEGLVRFSGASTYEPEDSRTCIESDVWDVIQMPANLLDKRHLQILDLAEEKGIGVVVRSVLFRGMLTGQPLNLPPELYEVQAYIEQLLALDKAVYNDLLTMAVKYVLSYPDVSAALIGMDKLKHLEKAIEVEEAHDLEVQTQLELEAMAFDNTELLNLSNWIKRGWLKS